MEGKSLESFVESVNGGSRLRVEHDFGDGFVRLRTSEAERRQAAQDIRNTEGIVLELLRNSRDAHAAHVFLAMSREGEKRVLTVIDDGTGIPRSMHGHVFEPRVTSKLDTNHMDAWGMHGRGMALYSISVNADMARVAASDAGLGCSIRVETNVGTLPERADQSSFPTFELVESGKVNVRGPRNIMRTACEFAIDARDSCSVYVGSPVEVASTLFSFGLATLSAVDRAFCPDWRQLPVVKRLATAADPAQFAEIASDAGLEVSQRSARRILDGAVLGLDPVIERIAIAGPGERRGTAKGAQAPPADARSLRLSRDDTAHLADAVRGAFADIAERYYLESGVEPSVRVSRDRIVVTVPVVRLP